jgi:hypothetical protein
VASTNILPIYTRLSERILEKAARLGAVGRSHVVGGNQIVEGLDRFWLALRCPSHTWSWPRANYVERVEGFDAHQTCHKCTSRRMFNTQEWHAGPVYRRVRG